MNSDFFMADVSLSFIKAAARAAVEAAVGELKVEVKMSGGDNWDTEAGGDANRSFSIELES